MPGLKESVFHLMLQNNVAPNIGQKLSSNQLPRIFGAGTALYNLQWQASVSNYQVQCNIPTFEALL